MKVRNSGMEGGSDI